MAQNLSSDLTRSFRSFLDQKQHISSLLPFLAKPTLKNVSCVTVELLIVFFQPLFIAIFLNARCKKAIFLYFMQVVFEVVKQSFSDFRSLPLAAWVLDYSDVP